MKTQKLLTSRHLHNLALYLAVPCYCSGIVPNAAKSLFSLTELSKCTVAYTESTPSSLPSPAPSLHPPCLRLPTTTQTMLRCCERRTQLFAPPRSTQLPWYKLVRRWIPSVYTGNQKPTGCLSALTMLGSLNNGPQVSDFPYTPRTHCLTYIYSDSTPITQKGSHISTWNFVGM